MKRRRLDPRSPDVRVNVYRSNPAGLGIAEIVALSGSPGVTDPSDQKMLSGEVAALRRAQQEAKDYIASSPLRNQKTGDTLFPYQEVGVGYFLEQAARAARAEDKRNTLSPVNLGVADYVERISSAHPVRMAILDPMGLGKTLQGIGCLIAGMELSRRFPATFPIPLPALIVCPMAVMSNWRDDLLRNSRLGFDDIELARSTLSPAVFEGYVKKGIKVVIAHPKILDPDANFTVGPHPSMLIVDEADFLREPTTNQSRAVQRLVDAASYAVFLTGTPAIMSSMEILPLLQILNNKPALTSAQDVEGAIDAWAKSENLQYRGEKSAFYEAGTVSDLIYPKDARRLERPIRETSVRRSRQTIEKSGTVDSSHLQLNKTRSVFTITPESWKSIRNEQLRDEAMRAWQSYVWAVEDLLAMVGSKTVTQLAEANAYLHGGVYPITREGRAEVIGLDAAMKYHIFGPFGNTEQALRGAMDPSATTTGALALQGLLRAVRSAYIPLPETGQRWASGSSEMVDVKIDLPAQMVEVAIAHVSAHQDKHQGKDLVYYIPRQTMKKASRDRRGHVMKGKAESVDLLEMAIRHLSLGDPEREIYVYTGEPKTNRVYVNNQVQSARKVDGEVIKRDFSIQSANELKRGERKARTLLISQTGRVGLNVLSGDVVGMLGRDTSPVMEDQIEDRINRTGRLLRGRDTPQPEVHYLFPEDVFAFALAHRLENRRRNLVSMYGEEVGEPPSAGRPAVWGSDRSHPVDVTDAIASYRTSLRSGVAANDLVLLKEQIIDLYAFLRDPEEWLARCIERHHAANPLALNVLRSCCKPDVVRPWTDEYSNVRRMTFDEIKQALSTESLTPYQRKLFQSAVTKESGLTFHKKTILYDDGKERHLTKTEIHPETKKEVITVQDPQKSFGKLPFKPLIRGELSNLPFDLYTALAIRCILNPLSLYIPAPPTGSVVTGVKFNVVVEGMKEAFTGQKPTPYYTVKP